MKTLTKKGLIRIGKIGFLNTLPFFHSWLVNGDDLEARFIEGYPQQINEKMQRGEVDIGLASSLFYGRHANDFLILPGFCIGAYQRSRSVTLYSSKPMESLNGATVALSAKSLSASSLLKILFKRRFGFENVFVDSLLSPEEMLRRFDACLLIGDEALFFRPPASFSYDLSGMWCEWTGYPFCFAVWIVRKSFFENHTWMVERVFEILQGNLNRNMGDVERITEEHGVQGSQKKLVAEYLQSLEYRLQDKVQSGLRLFFQYASEIGLVSKNVPLNFCCFPEYDTRDERCRKSH